jgi:hypothetical protein
MKLYSYFPSTGIETRHVVARCRKTLTVEHKGSIACEVVQRDELNSGGRYFTTARSAVEAFIVRAEFRLTPDGGSEQLSRSDRAQWRDALRAAQAVRAMLATTSSTPVRRGVSG